MIVPELVIKSANGIIVENLQIMCATIFLISSDFLSSDS